MAYLRASGSATGINHREHGGQEIINLGTTVDSPPARIGYSVNGNVPSESSVVE